MKTPDDIKKGLECGFCHECPYDNNKLETVEECARQVHKDALAYITQLESTYSQVSKALCGKENATLDEVLKAVDQLKSRLAQAERERDAAVAQLKELDCATCARMDINELSKDCRSCRNASNWQWRGVCEENSR